MVFWKSSALSIDPKKAIALSGWGTASVGAACAGGARLRGATPAAAAAPRPHPKNFLRDIARTLFPPELGSFSTEGRYSHDSAESTMAKMAGCVPAVKRLGEELAARRSPGLRSMAECRGWSRGGLFCCLVLREGKWEFEDLIADEDPQVELLRAFVALEPHCAGGFLFRREGR
jgi:hypothetical protein